MESTTEQTSEQIETEELSEIEARRRTATMLFSIMLIATNGVIYELLIAGYSSYLLGDSITQFSLTIGIFMSSMGVGSWLTQRVERDLERRFIEVELWLSLIGGPAVFLLAMAHIYTRVYTWVMFALIVILGVLIGFEIPLVTRVVHRFGNLKKAIANVLSFDYIGALVGSLLFPLFFLPTLGFTRTSFFIGALNLCIALLNIVVFKEVLGTSRRYLWICSVAIGIFLAVGFVYSTGWIEDARERSTGQKLVYLHHSPYQHIRLIRDIRHPKKPYRLYINGEHQFSTDSERRYHEALVHPAMSMVSSHKRVLLLGGGDGLALREIWRYPDVKEVVMVDLDPAMTLFAKKHKLLRKLNEGSLEDKRLKIVNTDAFLYIKKKRTPFNVVILDLPVPTQIALSKLYTVSFYKTLRKIVHKDGVAVTEAATLDPVENKPFWCLVKTQRTAGWKVRPMLHGPMAFTVMSHKTIQPRLLKLQVATKHLTTAAIRRAFSLPPDVTLPSPSQPNTLETHRLMYLVLALR